MPTYQCIECKQARSLSLDGALLLDIRDQNSFMQGHPSSAKNLNNDNAPQLLSDLSSEQHILVLCYHGISSKSAAEFISSQGFNNVASVNGGFEAWQQQFPEDIKPSSD
jgi:thiosulfate sulfurtransferase